jgi:hypothetical protein
MPPAIPLRAALIRSCAQEGFGPRAIPYQAVIYSAFRVSESGRTYALDALQAGSLEEALSEALTQQAFHHKEHILVRVSGDDGVKLHLFAVKKKSTPRYVHKDHVSRRVHDLYAAPVCSIDGSVL